MSLNKTMAISLFIAFNITTAQSYAHLSKDTIPQGWYRSGSNPQSYDMVVDTVVKHGGKASARITEKGTVSEGFGTMMQTFQAGKFKGKRVRMSAYAKTETADNAQVWMRVDGKESTLSFANMEKDPIKGTNDWKQYQITLDVPDGSVNIAFGFFLAGKGKVWADDFTFEEVGKNVVSNDMTTDEMRNQKYPNMSARVYPSKATNLNFEE